MKTIIFGSIAYDNLMNFSGKFSDSILPEQISNLNVSFLLPDLKRYKIERYELANINSLNFYIHDILEDGVSSNSRKDAQAKSLGEYLRAKKVNIPSSLLET